MAWARNIGIAPKFINTVADPRARAKARSSAQRLFTERLHGLRGALVEADTLAALDATAREEIAASIEVLARRIEERLAAA